MFIKSFIKKIGVKSFKFDDLAVIDYEFINSQCVRKSGWSLFDI